MVHPRVRGEHINGGKSKFRWFGSSPRARGTLPDQNKLKGVTRFIPACAGNTSSRFIWRLNTAVHPRVRGEHTPWRLPGSRQQRFIPACAGNTHCIGAHRGGPAGSSPRARGTQTVLLVVPSLWRFIPACAGNTAVSPGSRPPGIGSSPRARGTPWRTAGGTTRSAVHPRVRGEHTMYSSRNWRYSGSSPRARGTRQGRPYRARPGRFIPACAGNTNFGARDAR